MCERPLLELFGGSGRTVEAPSTLSHVCVVVLAIGVLGLLARGLTGEQIAERLVLSPETVRTHIRNAREKLGASTRVEAVTMALVGREIQV